MSRSWSVFAPVAIFAVLLVVLLPGGSMRPHTVHAAECDLDDTGTLIIRIIDTATGDELDIDGTQVLVKPDPRDFVLDNVVTDTAIPDANVSQDRDSDTGVIRIENACSTEGSESYTASLFELPESLEDCDEVASSDSTELEAEATETLTIEIDCTGVGGTPTPTATIAPTPGAAATVIANASPLSVSCNGTSIISITVRDAAGTSVGAGTTVAITTTLGTITAPNQVTGGAGTVNTFFAAPSSSGGTATITAKAGTASGTATVNVNCGAVAATATVAPPPAVGSGGGGGVIRPPNTGNAGLASTDGNSAWMAAMAGALAGAVCMAVGLRVVSSR